MRWLRAAVGLVLVNLLFMAGALIGVVLLGVFPAAVAAATVLGRMRSGVHSENLLRDFATVYRAQFWHANLIGAPIWVGAALVSLNIAFAQQAAAASAPLAGLQLTLATIVGAGLVLVTACALTLCTRYRAGAWATWRYAVVLSLTSPLMSLSLLISLGAMVLAFSAFGVLLPLLGAALPIFVATWFVDHRLARIDSGHPQAAAVA